VELDDSCFPYLIEGIKLFFFFINNIYVKRIAFFMFCLVFCGFIFDLLLHEFVNLRFQEESNVYQLLSHASQVGSTSFLLESFQVIKSSSQVLNLSISLASLAVDFFPDTVDIANLICQEKIIRKPLHEIIDLDVAPLSENLDPVSDLILFLTEVVVELIYKLLALFETSDMSLSPAVSLGLDHYGSRI
jgi:hypothetical protein